MSEPIAGGLRRRLLVASPTLSDPNFFRTVVLVIEHTHEGAVGVVLNRPSDLSVDGALPDWDVLAADPSVVFEGGPVGVGAAICLGRSRGDEEVDLIDLERHPDDVAAEAIRLFSGYAGWGPDQLEDEIAEGAWFVVDAQPDDILGDDPDGLWSRVLRRQPARLRVLANFPPTLDVN